MGRRFIAGAVCPECNAMDKLFVEAPSTTPVCAACGYEMQMPEGNSSDNVASDIVAPVAVKSEAVTLVNFKKK